LIIHHYRLCPSAVKGRVPGNSLDIIMEFTVAIVKSIS
jgi:hypothetical protein